MLMKMRYEIAALVCCVLLSERVYAGEAVKPMLMQRETTEDAIHLFVKGVWEPEEITCRYGGHISTEIGWHALTETGEGRETLVLIDNSLSTGCRYREEIETAVLKLFENASENERFCIATFGESTEYLTEYTNLYTPLEDAVLAIEYYDRDTYLTDAVMEVLDGWEAQEPRPVYRRIILLSDGQEQPSLTHTQEELYLRLKEKAYPVYTLGCVSSEKSALSHMAVLSRMTGAAAYRLENHMNEEELEAMALSLLEDREILHITMIPEPEQMDGSEVHAKLQFVKSGRVTKLDVKLQMPFQPESIVDAEAAEAAEAVPEEPSVTMMPLPAAEPAVPKQEQEISWVAGAVGLALGAMILLLGIYVVVLHIRENHRKNRFLSEERPSGSRPDTAWQAEPGDSWERYENTDTQLLRPEDEESENHTTLLFENEEVFEMILTDQSNPAKFFSFPIRDSVIVGRSARSSQIVLDYDVTISGRHCEIENRGGRFFVRDLQSANGTRVNGIRVMSETELLLGNLLKLGQVELKVGWNVHE